MTEAIINTPETKKSSKQTSSSHGTPDVGNAARWAILAMIESVDTGFRAAETKAKGLQANASALHRLIAEEKACKWNNIPKASYHYTYYVEITKNGGTVTWTTHGSALNKSQIDAANQANQEESKTRQFLQNKMTVLQQTGQVAETNVNSNVNETAQAMQETSALIKIVDSLTNMALLKHQ